MKNTAHRFCPQCGVAIAPGSLQGLCPNCLALVAFSADPDSERTVISSTAGSPHAQPAVNPPGARALISPALRYFGDYELLGEIARGGMGVVYRARQVKLNRTVALKMILSGKLATEADVKRFYTEAEAAANLQHPNIVAIHEVGEHEGLHYFSMDYVEGKNLADHIRVNPLSAADAAEFVKTIAEAIHYAHQRGTLHRDLKPHNVLIDANGQPRITDFGLAKRVEKQSDLTQTGAVMGTPSYMPPEQASGRPDQVGPQSDVYSLGAILYQMLTGKPPFAGATPLETLRQVMEAEPVRPSKSAPRTPPDLETICLKCLEKRPERRYHSARELADELGRFLNHEPILARPASAWRKAWSWSTRNPWALIGAAAAAGIVLLGFAYGLWVRVQYLEGSTSAQGAQLGPVPLGLEFSLFPVERIVIGTLISFPAVLFARWLKARRQRNLPVSNPQLVLLAAFGFSLITLGLWVDMTLIRLHVWGGPRGEFLWTLPAVVGACLGMPLVFCWAGGILIWQAIRRQQANWSGAVAPEAEWLPLQALHYSSIAFMAATLVNLASFVLIAYLGLAAGLFDRAQSVVDPSSTGKIALVTCFVLIAYPASFASWVYVTRKVYRRPALVSIFLCVVFVGVVIGWFSAPPYSSLPATFVLTAMLAGLAGGWMQVKWVKLKTVDSPEPVAPLVLNDVFQCDRRAFMITLAAVVVALGLLGRLYGNSTGVPGFLFLNLIIWSALLPAFFLAVRGTTGKPREFFQSMLMLAILCFAGPFAAMALMSGFKSPEILQWSAVNLVGLAAGCALVYFGKVRAKIPCK